MLILALFYACLLYTSDAADEEDSVDLGGRRIIKKINRENRANAAVIINNGYIIEMWIDDFDKMFIEAGWCKVFHQSTEYLIIGTLITPKIAMIEDIFITFSSFLKIFQDSKYIE